MRYRVPLFALLLVAGSLALPLAAHAGIPFFGPIIPDAYNQCAAGWGMLIDVINRIISLLITLAIVFVAPLMIAYAGFLFVVNPVNPSGKEKAKSVLLNTVVGIVIALAGWMIVDAIMVALYNPDTPIAGGRLGVWSDLIGSHGALPCIPLAESLRQAVPGVGITGIDASGGQFLALPTSGDCVASNLIQATAGSAYTLTQSQANTLSCIAVPESRCGSNTTGATQPNGTPTSASGMFQIVFGSGNDRCHNLNIPACSQAAGVDGNLNCYSAFRGGLPAPGKEAAAAACRRAAANLSCNAQAASCLIRADNGFSAWTSDPRSSTQQNCITQYASLR
ncbi:MAG: pilin [bacterium]|nr:pilin [bacterium]